MVTRRKMQRRMVPSGKDYSSDLTSARMLEKDRRISIAANVTPMRSEAIPMRKMIREN